MNERKEEERIEERKRWRARNRMNGRERVGIKRWRREIEREVQG